MDFDGEAIRVRTSYSYGAETTPKSGKVRAVPMVPDVAQALARLGQRDCFTDRADLVFPSATGGYADSSALRRRYKDALARAGLRPLRFHDLRHTFAHWPSPGQAHRGAALGRHADMRTTQRSRHHKSRADEARRLAEAFRVADRVAEQAASGVTERT